MSEPMDKREEVELPLHLKHLEYGAINRMMSPPDAVISLISQLKAALAANREKDAEIERLKAATLIHNDSAVEAWKLTQQWQKRVFDLEAELSSLRASVGGEKWIPCTQELPPMGKLVIVSMGNIVQTCLYSWNEIDRCWSPFDEDFDSAPDGTFDFWQPLPAPPSLPTEKE